MRNIGIVLLVIGGLMLSGLGNLATTKYNLQDSHDQSKLLFGGAIALLVFISGLSMLLKGSKTSSPTQKPPVDQQHASVGGVEGHLERDQPPTPPPVTVQRDEPPPERK